MVQQRGIDGDGTIVEWAPFRSTPSVSDEVILARSEALQRDFLEQQPGYVRRELLRSADGLWVDLVYWKDQASVDEAMRAAETSEACKAYFQLMVGANGANPGEGLLLMQRLRTY
jgi:hypothetical protein